MCRSSNLARRPTEMRALPRLRPPTVPRPPRPQRRDADAYTLRAKIRPSDVNAELSLVRREGARRARAHAGD